MDKRRITGIEQQKKNSDRVNIFLDDQFALGLYKIVAFHLQIGDILDEVALKKLEAEDTKEDAYQKALRFLSYRPRTEYEVRSRLGTYGFSNPVIESVIENLLEKEYLDDQKFAEEWVENRTALHPRGKRLLQIELRKKHVDEEKIQIALETVPDEENLVRSTAQKYCSRLKGLDKVSYKKRLYGFLARRGFSYEDIKPIVDEMWEEKASVNSKENEVLKNA